MTLNFITTLPKDMPAHLAGKPTYFVKKIWEGIAQNVYIPSKDFNSFYDKCDSMGIELNIKTQPKLHTIRFMTPERAKQWEGKMIDFYIHNRTKEAFKFAPRVPVKSIQLIEIRRELMTEYTNWVYEVELFTIDGKVFNDLDLISKNDGFDSSIDFFHYFNESRIIKNQKQGKFPYIIHWTDLKY